MQAGEETVAYREGEDAEVAGVGAAIETLSRGRALARAAAERKLGGVESVFAVFGL